MCDFAFGRCESVKEPERFLDAWFKTAGNPCSVCETDKSECGFHKEFVDRGAISEGENPP